MGMDRVGLALAKPARRAALERPYQSEHEQRQKERLDEPPPTRLRDLLAWYAGAWDQEVPIDLHKWEVWRDHGQHAEGGSHLGSPAYADQFRRYLENIDSELDEDGYFMRPVHAALSRMHRRWPLTVQALYMLARSGMDWRALGERLHMADEMACLYVERALAMLHAEYREQVVRLA